VVQSRELPVTADERVRGRRTLDTGFPRVFRYDNHWRHHRRFPEFISREIREALARLPEHFLISPHGRVKIATRAPLRVCPRQIGCPPERTSAPDRQVMV
jgi:hypothetical protein